MKTGFLCVLFVFVSFIANAQKAILEADSLAMIKRCNHIRDSLAQLTNISSNENILVGKWTDADGLTHVTINKNGTNYLIEYDFSADAKNTGNFVLNYGVLQGKTSNQFYPNNFTNDVFTLSNDKKMLNMNGNIILHKVERFSYEK
jgi:hypothetical protein